MLIPPQRHLFDIPDDVAYLNCAYMSPLMHEVVAAGRQGVARKALPWRLQHKSPPGLLGLQLALADRLVFGKIRDRLGGRFEFASSEESRSPTISCLRPPPGIEAPDLVSRLAEAGMVVGGGYGDWKPTTFRIGHMGEIRQPDLVALFDVIDRILGRPG